MQYDQQIYLLSQTFISNYPLDTYPELMYKSGRPYSCLLVDTHDGYFLCIPFRSAISHNNCYHFIGTIRSQKSKSGLDYSKMVIIRDTEYIDSETPAVVDQDEYSELMKNLPRIVTDVCQYVDTYINHRKGVKMIHPREYERKYKYSTLPYFDDILLQQ